jgi:predicted HTH transcriptional regulator
VPETQPGRAKPEGESGDVSRPSTDYSPDARPLGLTHRQQKIYRHILEKGRITRLEYQALVGGNLPPRTAIYDLHDLVRKGVLRKEGKGPATRYLLARPMEIPPNPGSGGV